MQYQQRCILGNNGYLLTLKPTVNGELYFEEERTYFAGNFTSRKLLGSGHKRLLPSKYVKEKDPNQCSCYDAIKKWRIYHFHDTKDTEAAVKRACSCT